MDLLYGIDSLDKIQSQVIPHISHTSSIIIYKATFCTIEKMQQYRYLLAYLLSIFKHAVNLRVIPLQTQ